MIQVSPTSITPNQAPIYDPETGPKPGSIGAEPRLWCPKGRELSAPSLGQRVLRRRVRDVSPRVNSPSATSGVDSGGGASSRAVAASQSFTAAHNRLSMSSCGPRASSGPPFELDYLFAEFERTGVKQHNRDGLVGQREIELRAADCLGVSSAVSSVLTWSSSRRAGRCRCRRHGAP